MMKAFYFITIGFWVGVNCHPQCLDYRPPFDADELDFCTQYSNGATCCSAEKDLDLEMRFEDLKLTIPPSELAGCEEYVKTLLCQECSPYAAHVFDAEVTLNPRQVPGLCDEYCDDFYDSCKAIIPHMYDLSERLGDTTLGEALESKETFCPAVGLVDVDYCYPDLLTNPILNYNISREYRDQPGCLCFEEFASEIANPLVFRFAPDDSGRIFIGQQRGIVEVFYKDKTKVEEPFLDMSEHVLLTVVPGDERGFLNLVFHPNFKENRKFYVYFSTQNEDSGQHYTRVSELKESATQTNSVESGSERLILEVAQPYANHNGGEMVFGDDGYLYVFLGDGGNGGDPDGNAQNRNTLLGKALRIDVNTGDDGVPYTIPSDNPFVSEEGTRDEIWALGIRNIWRCDKDEGDPDDGHGKGRIICGDVGQSAYEEIDIIEKGGNFGWNGREGFECYNEDTCGQLGPEVLPIHAYSHDDGKSVTGGNVYRGCMNPNLEGHYIYADFVVGRIWALTEDRASGDWTNREILMCGPDVCFNDLAYDLQTNIMSFGEDEDGEIYVLTTNFGAPSGQAIGKVVKLIDPKRRGNPTNCRTYVPDPTDPTSNASGIYTSVTALSLLMALIYL